MKLIKMIVGMIIVWVGICAIVAALFVCVDAALGQEIDSAVPRVWNPQGYAGSGVIIELTDDSKGVVVVTNHHVIAVTDARTHHAHRRSRKGRRA